MPVNGRIHQLDLGCFRDESLCPWAVGLEIESNHNWNSPAILSNENDLKKFSELYKNSAIFHIPIDTEINFEEEFAKIPECQAKKENLISKNENNVKNTYKLPKGRIGLSW